MDRASAKEFLLLHSFSHPQSASHPKAKSGFLGSLRPYAGSLNPDNFREVMDALVVLASDLREKPSVDRQVVGALWGIVNLSRVWAIEPDGMLQRNGLIDERDIQRLARWIGMISYATMTLLDGGSEEEAFDDYRKHGTA